MQLPITIAQRIAELARSAGDAAALAKARELARVIDDNQARDAMVAFSFVDHSEAIFIDGRLFTIKLTFDIPGESQLPEGIEPPFLSSPTTAEEQLLASPAPDLGRDLKLVAEACAKIARDRPHHSGLEISEAILDYAGLT
jgi:hypothetical protein